MLDRLREVVGAESIASGGEPERWSVHGVAPRAVVAPASAEEAAAVLSLATAEGWAVEFAGSGGRLDAGRPPARVDLVVTTRRLTGLAAFEPADLVASVGAGTVIGILAQRLEAHRQWLPLDPPGAGTATLGAVVSDAAAGPLRRGYGTPRDHVLGLQLVTGDGRILELGGRVVKNVAGYDLVRLVVGSRGTLGLITRVDVRLRALPDADQTLVLTGGPDRLLGTTVAMREARLEPVASELVSPGQGYPTGGDPLAWTLLVRFQGNADAVADAEVRLRALPGGGEAVALPDDAAAAAWADLAAAEAAAPLVVRLADRPALAMDTLRLALRLPGAVERWPVAAHVGDGIVRALIPIAALEDPGVARWTEALAEARAVLAARRGTLVVARAPRMLVDGLDPWGDAGPAIGLMRGLKKQFDPAGVVAPGRFAV